MQFNDFQLLKDGKPVSFKEAEYAEWVEYEVWKAKLNVSVVLLEDE